MNTLGSIGHALVTERVGACYSVREGVGTGAWGARRRKAAMWKMLAAGEWLDAGKMAQCRACLDEAGPLYVGTGFAHIAEFVEVVKRHAGYGVVGDRRGGDGGESSGEEEEVESEVLGGKRMSMVSGVGRSDLLETGAGADDDFITES